MPEARVGGPIALVHDGDRIIVDAQTKSIDWLVDEETKSKRKAEWDASDKGKLTVKRGVLLRYARDVAVSRKAGCIPWRKAYLVSAGKRRGVLRLASECMRVLFV